jgi:phage terminase small subunit
MSWGSEGVRLRESAELSDADAALVSDVAEGKDGEIRIKLHSKLTALSELGKHLGASAAPRPCPCAAS